MSPKKQRTVSEDVFEELCRSVGIACDRVDETTTRTPDYELKFSGHRIVAEVKQFDPNDTEAKVIDSLKQTGKAEAFSTKPGDRIRKAVHSAAPQLKALSKGECPTMLVVYNNVLSARLHTDPYAVATAMDGFDEVPVLVPKDPSLSPVFKEARSGRGKKMTASANTTISAIGVLFNLDDGPWLDVYHNRHARHPIEPAWLRTARTRHFRRPANAANSLDEWEEV